ncbi:hypothetical protein K2173_003115 [Erythroxylum novogranatense]|uniref:B box-type domain-containing protein n=1 Tax=Erythroxylum novogranatense TaxID=1862640 RepID=A0AAV8TBS4_9ROSI|nr:hypothetical protein K2173_003115 [Erythroxylum novogranatense]
MKFTPSCAFALFLSDPPKENSTFINRKRRETHRQRVLRDMKKGCELCGGAAIMYCESDQASLCWICDEKVHCANFLVAKHCRSLLCQVCQSPTPWKASGPRLGHTVSICQSCFSVKKEDGRKFKEALNGEFPEEGHEESQYGDDERDDGSEDYDDDEEEEEEETDDKEEEDGENQVVPWSGTTTIHMPQPATSSSSEERFPNGFFSSGGGLKRTRDDNYSEDEIESTSSDLVSQRLITTEERSSYLGSIRPIKQQGVDQLGDHGEVEESRSSAVYTLDSLKRLRRDMVTISGKRV